MENDVRVWCTGRKRMKKQCNKIRCRGAEGTETTQNHFGRDSDFFNGTEAKDDDVVCCPSRIFSFG